MSETLLSLQYGLPTLPFVARPSCGCARKERRGRSGTARPALRRDRHDHGRPEPSGSRQGLSFVHPHFSSATTTNGSRVRRRLTVALCGDPRGGKPQHRISLFGYDEEGRRVLEELGLSLRPAYKGSTGWRFETCHSDLARIAEIVRSIQAVLDVSVRYTARLGNSQGALGKERNSLPFMLASSVRPGMVMVTDTGDFDVVVDVERVELDAPVYDLDIERTHNFIANGLVTHNSIYAFRGADIRNILEFERDFPNTKVIPLEQNYRSTNTILQVANDVISNNRDRKEKNLWSDLGDGEPVRVVETEDEHAEARFVAAEIAGLIEQGYSAREVAVVYRTNAQSRVLEDVLVRQGIAYQVIGGPQFYERAEIKDAIAYLQVLDNPYDAVSLMRIANRPRRGIGDTSIARLVAYADGHGSSLWEAMGRVGGGRPRSCVDASGQRLPRRDGDADGNRHRRERRADRRGGARPHRLHRVTRSRAYDRGARPHREPRGARRRRARVRRRCGRHSAGRAAAERLPAGDLALLRPGRSARRRRRRRRPGDADDAAQREGARVPRCLHARDGGGDLPARALDRGELARGGAAARLRRHDARKGAADADARDAPQSLRSQRGEPPVAVPRRDSTAWASSASACGLRRGRTTARAPSASTPRAPTCPTSRPATPFATRRSAPGS